MSSADPIVSNSQFSNNPDIDVRGSRTTAGKILQHVRIDFGIGTAEEQLSPSNPMPIRLSPCVQAVQTSVAASASSVPLLSANPDRCSASVTNESSSATLYLSYAATASVTNYKVPIAPGGYFEFPQPVYPGDVSGIWSAAVGNARICEEF